MGILAILELLNYCLVFLFGLFLSVLFAGGLKTKRQIWLICLLAPFLLAVQGLCMLIWDADTVRKLYPLIVHLPLTLLLTVVLKKQCFTAIVSVCTAYLCCQLPRWVRLLATALSASPLIGEICYILFIVPIFLLLRKFFVRRAYAAMTYSSQSLILFGVLPAVYYVYDYATAVYADALLADIPAINEFLPTILIIFYVLFLTAWHAQMQKRTQAEVQSTLLEAKIKQSGAEMESLRRAEVQIACYQHDMRHHLNMIESLLAGGQTKHASQYIQKVQSDVQSIIPKRFCENETLNLLFSAFVQKARELNVLLTESIQLPNALPISDPELCAMVSNALENALHAVSTLPPDQRWIKFYCNLKQNKLLIEVKNPYTGNIEIRDGVPTSAQNGHGYGCRSIRAIAEKYRGLCSFEPDGGVFTLRIVLPVAANA